MIRCDDAGIIINYLFIYLPQTIGKDVRRTERQHPYFSDDDSEGLRMLRRILITLSVYDTEVAYVQGMNEIVAPILLTLQVKLQKMLRTTIILSSN